MKTLMLVLGCLIFTLSSHSVIAAQTCGGDGDGSSSFNCESGTGDVFLDGYTGSDGVTVVRIFEKNRREKIYSGVENQEFKLQSAAVVDFSKKSFSAEGTNGYNRFSLVSMPKALKVQCRHDSAKFVATLTYRFVGYQDRQIPMSCYFGYSH